MNSTLWLVFLTGLAGSMHCIGMCGGIMFLVSKKQEDVSVLARQVAYFLGKTITYTILGVAVGLLGAALSNGFQGFQKVLSIVAGIFMIFIGLGLLGVVRNLDQIGSLNKTAFYKKVFAYFVRQTSTTGALGLGLLNGLLPCGLVYGALATAVSTGSVQMSALTMFVFGIATIPALAIFGLLANYLTPLARKRGNQLAGVFMIIMGIMSVLHATEWGHKMMHSGQNQDATEQHDHMNGMDHSKMNHDQMNQPATTTTPAPQTNTEASAPATHDHSTHKH